MDPDYDLLGRVIAHEVKRYPGGRRTFHAEAKISRASVDRAINGRTTFEQDILDRIEHGLNMPDGCFQLIAMGKYGPLVGMGVRAALVRWIKNGAREPIEAKEAAHLA